MGDVRSDSGGEVHDGQPDEAEAQGCEHNCPEGVLEAIVISAGGSGGGGGGAIEVEVGGVEGIFLEWGVPPL